MAGFKSILACDFWKPACLTFKNNFPNCPLFEGDVKDLNKEALNKLIGKEIENIDVVVGGPPCQGFSTAGKQWIDDPRNRLFIEFIRIISLVKPKYVVMENVPPILTLASGRFLKEIFATYNQNGYQVKANILNSRYFGVPQERKRAVFLAWKNGLKEPQYPEPKALPYITCKEAISDLENEEFAEIYDNLNPLEMKRKINKLTEKLNKTIVTKIHDLIRHKSPMFKLQTLIILSANWFFFYYSLKLSKISFVSECSILLKIIFNCILKIF